MHGLAAVICAALSLFGYDAPHLTQHEAVSVAVFAGVSQGLPAAPDECRAVRRDMRICTYRDGESARVRQLKDGSFLLVRRHQGHLDVR